MITIVYLTAAKLQPSTLTKPNSRLHVLTLRNPLKTAKSRRVDTDVAVLSGVGSRPPFGWGTPAVHLQDASLRSLESRMCGGVWEIVILTCKSLVRFMLASPVQTPDRSAFLAARCAV